MLIPFIISVLILLVLLFIIIHELRRSAGPLKGGKPPVWKKRIRVALALVPLLLFSLAIWAVFIDPSRLVIRSQTIRIDNWPAELSGLRIAVMSDIHAGSPFINDRKLYDIVAKTNAGNPDLIVLLGDYMTEDSGFFHRVEPEVTAARLKGLRAPLGVYAVLGNHDWWYNGAKVRSAFEQNGIQVLEGEVAELQLRGKSFWLAGLADLWTRPQHIAETVAKAPQGATIVAITHNPDVFPRLPQSVSLLLAGHTHGGQVNIPLIGTPVVPSDFGPKYTAGHVVENTHHLFVTTGIGTSILPIRFRVPPEIVLLTIVN